ncbi:cytochrome P450 [Crucibulum laeve]|uniref:Cytochrome P450 n=1 Tax=Crucibulum laeve TaxID=68775 RepID=A0A5C3MHZ0_9AGAR|nr:cytochrome P450 [Crucibulum laeve]
MTFSLPLAVFILLSGAYALYRRLTRISIADIPGPASDSFLLGNICELFQNQAGETDFRWQEEYGNVVRFKGSFGEDRLLISDPKALQYIYQTSGYNFPKQNDRKEISRFISGRGILWSDGDQHKRHRKVMLPGFGGPETKAFAPLFTAQASRLVSKWIDLISVTSDQSTVVDIPLWASRTALDAVGAAAFDYKFEALENAENPLRKAYENLFAGLFGSPTKASLFATELLQYIPINLISSLLQYFPSPRLERVRQTAQLATKIAKSLVDSKAEAAMQGKGNRDVMSLLVQANASENVKAQLNEEEVLAQMRTMILAGHETTANTLTWTLLELARNPDIQGKLRHEIRSMEKVVHERGEPEFTAADFDRMSYLNAVIKESLRYHPVALFTFREASKEDVLPLSKPITTLSGEIITELPIPKGQRIMSSICAYNRIKDIFGEDSHTFKPERWLNGDVKRATSIGVYGNLMTFSSGIRSCIGWRFAILELQAFLAELVNNFEFSLTLKATRLRREACLVMIPTVEGEVEKGSQLPLMVRVASREE